MVTESPDLRVSLDLLDMAIDLAVEKLPLDEIRAATEAVGEGGMFKLYARPQTPGSDEPTLEEIHHGLEETFYDERCHHTQHPYFVEAVVQRLMLKHTQRNTADFARVFPEFYRQIRDEQMDVTDQGKLILFGWVSPERRRQGPDPAWLRQVDDEDVVTGLELLEDLYDALRSGPVVEMPVLGEQRRWRKLWDEDLDRLRRYYELSRERITKLLLEQGELSSLEILPEKYPKKERYRIGADRGRVADLIEAFLEEYERRPWVRIKRVSKVPGWGPSHRRPRRKERVQAAAAGLPPGSPPPPDMTWIADCDLGVLREYREVLGDVLRAHDRRREPQVISPYPHGTSDMNWGEDYFGPLSRQRWEIVRALVAYRIFESARQERPIPVVSKRGVVAEAIRTIDEHLDARGQLASPRAPQTTQTPLARPASDDPSVRGPDEDYIHAKRLHREERIKMPYAILTAVIIAVILGALGFFFTPVGDWVREKYFPKTRPASSTVPSKPDSSKSPASVR